MGPEPGGGGGTAAGGGGSADGGPMHAGTRTRSRTSDRLSLVLGHAPTPRARGWRSPCKGTLRFQRHGGCGLTPETFSVNSHWCHPGDFKSKDLLAKQNKTKQTKTRKTKTLNLFIEIPKATFYLFYIFIYYIEFIFNEICTGQIGILEALGSVSSKRQSLLPTCGQVVQVRITSHGREKF